MSEPMELWGGHECTVNRVGDTWRDQTRLSGHQSRLCDLERFASLGLSALRYPVLWERVSPDQPDEADFTWEAERLAEIQRLGMRPIVGLIHHGSGPRYTDLLSESFAPGLAEHARRAAQAFPWVTDWTPVNEPLTTARFSALYGIWHPHERDERSFWLALLNQIDAVRSAMREIRRIQPEARLIQTEDLGFTQATPRAAAQARFENERRWLTWDLLAGRVTPGRRIFAWGASLGFGDRLRAIADDPCPADVIGVNHYLTSERFLDEAVEAYPPHVRGGNGRIAYADLETVRVGERVGLKRLLIETWERYGAAVAMTECHNGCTREEQMRWFTECWRDAHETRAEGCDIRAVTAWSLLGSFDWSNLLTRADNAYEPGVFDVRGGFPRETAVCGLLRALARGEAPSHPAASQPGWWRRPERLFRRQAKAGPTPDGRPVLITGRTGTLGQAFARACVARGLPFVLTDRAALRITSEASIAAALARHEPWAVINAAGYVRVDDAETDEAACLAANAAGAALLAQACAAAGLGFVTFSSDLVFDGALGRPYVETDAPSPLSAYGRSKAEAERSVALAHPGALIVRTAAFFSPEDSHNFAHAVLSATGAGRPFSAATDCLISPTFVPDLVEAALDLLIDADSGLWHLANAGDGQSWAAFARDIAAAAGFDPGLVQALPAESFGWAAPRPRDVRLTSQRAILLPPRSVAVDRMARAWVQARAAA